MIDVCIKYLLADSKVLFAGFDSETYLDSQRYKKSTFHLKCRHHRNKLATK